MAVESRCRVVGVSCADHKLTNDVLIVFGPVVAERIFGIERRTHVDAVQPHLVRVDQLVPESPFLGAWLTGELCTEHVKRFLILDVFRLFVNTEKDFTSVDAVQTQFGGTVGLDASVVVYHRVAVLQGIVVIPLVAVSVIQVEKPWQ